MTPKQSSISRQPGFQSARKWGGKKEKGKTRIRNNDKIMLFVWQQTPRNTSEGIQGNWVSIFAFLSGVPWRWGCYVLSRFESKLVYDKSSVCFRLFMFHSASPSYTDARYGSLAVWEMRDDFSQRMSTPVFCSEDSTRFLLITGQRGYELKQTA